MFETTVKHFVYDFCIGLVFDKWKDNFVSASGDIPKLGDMFTRISHIIEDEHYYDCKVRNVINKHTRDGQSYSLVYLNYQSSSGMAVKAWEEEVNEYLEENNIDISDVDMSEDYIDDEYDNYEIIDDEIEELMNNEEIEYMEYPDMICINTLYYVFYK